MRKASEYEAHADECRRMAAQAKNQDQKAQLINMAETWEMLARARRRKLGSPAFGVLGIDVSRH
jgi:hypothetical protein